MERLASATCIDIFRITGRMAECENVEVQRLKPGSFFVANKVCLLKHEWSIQLFDFSMNTIHTKDFAERAAVIVRIYTNSGGKCGIFLYVDFGIRIPQFSENKNAIRCTLGHRFSRFFRNSLNLLHLYENTLDFLPFYILRLRFSFCRNISITIYIIFRVL